MADKLKNKILLKPKKSLGQNFLVDDNISRKIVNSLRLCRDDVVLEIGPGHGSITKYIIKSVKKLIGIEIDSSVAADLKSAIADENFELVNDDILSIDFSKYKKKYKRKIRLAGNIPYHLTSSILIKSFNERDSISDITLMIQKEVADRIITKSGSKNYGILSVFSQFYGKPQILFNVSPNCFYPKPKVMSSVIKIDFYDKFPYDVEENLFRIVVKTAFGKRRKTLKNSLKYLPFDEAVIDRIISNLTKYADLRPEQLSVSDFVILTNEIEKRIANE